MQHVDFLNTRGRFQRTTDGEMYSGWIVDWVGDHIALQPSQGSECLPGDEFIFTALGVDTAIQFTVTLIRRGADIYYFRQTSAPREVPPSESARVKTPDMAATVRYVGGAERSLIIDVSAAGMGLLTGREFRSDESVHLTIEFDGESWEFDAEVRYSNRLSEFPPQYRTGVNITGIDRHQVQRWNRFFALAS